MAVSTFLENNSGIVTLEKQEGLKMKKASRTYRMKEDATNQAIYDSLEIIAGLIDSETYDNYSIRKRETTKLTNA